MGDNLKKKLDETQSKSIKSSLMAGDSSAKRRGRNIKSVAITTNEYLENLKI